jgi:hypothetical protein
MSGLSLGKLLQEAGIKGGKPSTLLTLDEAKALSRKTPAETYSKEAMDRLSVPFARLKNPNEIKEGKDFIRELCDIFKSAKNNIIGGYLLSEHTIIGICQLAHWHRDRVDLSPSRRKSFNRIIPWLLERRDKIQKKPPKDIGQYMSDKLDERGGWVAF